MSTNPPEHCLPITTNNAALEDLPSLIGSALVDVKRRTSAEYSSAFYRASKAAEERSDERAAAIFRSLGILCSFHPNYENRAEPYGPMFVFADGRRAAQPSDLTDKDLDLIAKIVEVVSDPVLGARLRDVLWIRRKDAAAARRAVDDLLAVASQLVSGEESWIYAAELYRRALVIGSLMGRKNEPWKKAEAALVSAIGSSVADRERFFAARLLDIAVDLGAGEAASLVVVARTHGDRAHAATDPCAERQYRLIEADLCRRAKDSDGEGRAMLLAAETYVVESEAALRRAQPSNMVAADFLARGIEALRQARAPADRVRELRARLADLQQASVSELKRFEFNLDLTKESEKAREYVRGRPFPEAIQRLALGVSMVDAKKLREEVLKLADDFPLSHLFGGSLVDDTGRVIERTEGIAAPNASEQAIEARMFQQAVMSHWLIRAAGLIDPARIEIVMEHHPNQHDLAYLVRHNPFIPAGHEMIYLRGLHHGLMGDLMIASHLLAPQIENSIRHILVQHGADVSNLESDLTQPVKTLGPLFGMPEMKEVFGDDLCFELRGHLIEKTGYSFRHRVAHGFISEGECYSEAALNVWWLALRLCVVSFLFRQQAENA